MQIKNIFVSKFLRLNCNLLYLISYIFKYCTSLSPNLSPNPNQTVPIPYPNHTRSYPYYTIPISRYGRVECDMLKYGYGRVRYGYWYTSKSVWFGGKFGKRDIAFHKYFQANLIRIIKHVEKFKLFKISILITVKFKQTI